MARASEISHRANEQERILAEFKSLKKSSPPYCYLHFSMIQKVGINPKYGWHNPIGVYVYVLCDEITDQFKFYLLVFKNFLKNPRQLIRKLKGVGMFSNMPFLFILKAKHPDRVLYTSKPISINQLHAYASLIKELAEREPELFDKKWLKYLKQWSSEKLVYDFTIGKIARNSWFAKVIFAPVELIPNVFIPYIKVRFPRNYSSVIFEMAKVISAGTFFVRFSGRKPITWATILRNIGIEGFIDDANLGVLWQKTEPRQGMFFSGAFLQVVVMEHNPFSVFKGQRLIDFTSSSFQSDRSRRK